MDISKSVFEKVAKDFCINGDIVDLSPMTNGNINVTCMVP
jgi:hypothetical protein